MLPLIRVTRKQRAEKANAFPALCFSTCFVADVRFAAYYKIESRITIRLSSVFVKNWRTV